MGDTAAGEIAARGADVDVEDGIAAEDVVLGKLVNQYKFTMTQIFSRLTSNPVA